jgi:hypothetical protein
MIRQPFLGIRWQVLGERGRHLPRVRVVEWAACQGPFHSMPYAQIQCPKHPSIELQAWMA